MKYIGPVSGIDLGGTVITAFGDNLYNNSANWTCSIDGVVVLANWISSSQVVCAATPQAKNTSAGHNVPFLLLQNGVAVWDAASPNGYAGTTTFFYIGTCSNSACQNHGVCSLGNCICDYGWMGSNCDIQQIPLKLQPLPSNFNEAEFATLSVTPVVLNGTGPVSWSLWYGPSGVQVNPSTGQITWNVSSTAGSTPGIGIMAANGISTATLSFTVSITASYYCTATTTVTVSPNYNPSSAVQIPISGYCKYIATNQPVGNVEAKVWVENNGVLRVFATPTTYPNGQYISYFYPSSYEAGNFTFGAANPLASTSNYTVSGWFVLLGIAPEPNTISIGGLPGWLNSFNVSSIVNLGNTPLTNLTYAVYGLDSIMQTAIVDFIGYPQGSVINLAGSQVIGLNITTYCNFTWYGTLGVQFFVNEQVYPPYLNIYMRCQAPVPRLTLDKSSINSLVARGAISYFSFTITNVGNAQTQQMQVNMPTGIPFLSLSSPTVISSLQPNQSATVTISVAPSANQTFGTVSGSIGVSSPIIGASVGFYFEIVSTNVADLLVIVQDEYTFLAPGNPLVNNSIVTISNQVTGQQYNQNPCNGSCFFQNITENNYRIDVSGKLDFMVFFFFCTNSFFF